MTTTLREELAPTREEVLEHLQAILADRRFASAERNAGFLKYVVQRALDGKADEIKETVIATEVYGRSTDYDPKADSIVRVEASRLRQKLRSYYESEGQSAPIRFLLPSGSYVPRFERVEKPAVPQESTQVVLPESMALPASAAHPPRESSLLIPERATTFAWVAIVAVLLLYYARSVNAANTPDADAVAAWEEGVSLLQQDPHVGRTEHGAPKTLVRAIERLEFAVVFSPSLAPAWATLAEAYDYAFAYVGRDRAEYARRAEAAAHKAIALDGKLAAGHHMLGLVSGFIKWEYAKAEASYRRALALNPYDVYATVEYADLLHVTGRAQQAMAEVRKARALLPALPQLAVKEAEIHIALRQPDAAISAAQSAVDLRQDYTRAHLALATAYEMKGDYQQALSLYQHALQSNPMDRRALPAYGYLLGKTGQVTQAKLIAKQLENMNENIRNCAFQIAVVYAGLGEEETALNWLEAAWKTHQAHFPFAAVEHRFQKLHSNPRFRDLLSRVGLQPIV